MSTSYSYGNDGRKIYDDEQGAMLDRGRQPVSWAGMPDIGGGTSSPAFRSPSMGGGGAGIGAMPALRIPEMGQFDMAGDGLAPGNAFLPGGQRPVAAPGQAYMAMRDERTMALQAMYAERLAKAQAQAQAAAQARAEQREQWAMRMQQQEAERNRQAQMIMQARGLGNDNYLAAHESFKKWGI